MFRRLFAPLLSLCLLAIPVSPSFAAEAPPPRTIRDIVVLLDQYKPDPAYLEKVRTAMVAQPAAGLSGAALANFYLERAHMAQSAGAVRQQIEDLRHVVEIGGMSNIGRIYKELSTAEFIGGNFQEALDSRLKAIANTGDGALGRLVNDYALLAEMYRRLGQLEEAAKAERDTEGMFVQLRSRSRAWPDLMHNWTASYQDGRGRSLLAAGKLQEAEVAFRDALREITLDLPINPQRIARGMDMPPQELLESFRDSIELRLADSLMQQGRLFDAEIHIRNSLQSSLKRVGRYSFQTAQGVLFYSRLLLEQRRASEAQTLIRAAIDILEQIGATPDSVLLTFARRQLASTQVIQGQWQAALEQYKLIEAAYPAALRSRLAGGDINWGLTLLKTGQPEAAKEMLIRLVADSSRITGAKSARTAELRGYLGMALAKLDEREAALRALQESLAVLVYARNQDKPTPAAQRRLTNIVNAYIGLLARIRGTPLEKQAGLDAAAEAFRLADASRGQDVQQAIAEAAARSAAGTPELAALIRKSQDLKQETNSLYRVLVDLLSAPPEKQLPKVIADMQQRIAAIEEERKALEQRLARQFPAYADLVNPRPASLDTVRAVLRQGESLISVVSNDDQSYIWAIPKQGPVAFAVSTLKAEDIARMVSKLRSALDPGSFNPVAMPNFDVLTSRRLHDELLEPVKAGWQGASHLLVSTGGALSQLPFALLATADEAPGADKSLPNARFRQVPWLIRQAAVTHIPSINTLVTLRQQKAGNPARQAFLGFGDPDFSGQSLASADTGKTRMRNLKIERVQQETAAQANAPGWMDYSAIPPLPDTRDEILALARALHADLKADVLLGPDASKSNLKKLDLASRRIIAFATHGLIPGDFPGVDQPALALANPGGGESGLLTLEEILGLKLDADWVVLSACNTAAGDGAGAEAVSGLGKGFFYAGSRALLVTHWPVETVSARLLVTGIFSRYADNPDITRAEALRQSILALIDSPGALGSAGRPAYSYAHPLFWAPYALVGDGGAH